MSVAEVERSGAGHQDQGVQARLGQGDEIGAASASRRLFGGSADVSRLCHVQGASQVKVSSFSTIDQL
jgi:hypothetical protein